MPRRSATHHRWYLVAYHTGAEQWRLFRVDRMRSPHPTTVPNAKRQPPADPAEFVTPKLHSLVPVYEAVVTLRVPAAEVGAHLGGVDPLDGRSCRLRMHPDTVEWLAFRLSSLDCEFRGPRASAAGRARSDARRSVDTRRSGRKRHGA